MIKEYFLIAVILHSWGTFFSYVDKMTKMSKVLMDIIPFDSMYIEIPSPMSRKGSELVNIKKSVVNIRAKFGQHS